MTTATPRPPGALPSVTYRQVTPPGPAFVTVVSLDGEPFEVFVNMKGGSENAALTEALGRLLSMWLQVDDPGTPTERLRMAVDQLVNIGSDSPVGFGPGRVSSLPDGVAKALENYLGDMNLLESG